MKKNKTPKKRAGKKKYKKPVLSQHGVLSIVEGD